MRDSSTCIFVGKGNGSNTTLDCISGTIIIIKFVLTMPSKDFVPFTGRHGRPGRPGRGRRQSWERNILKVAGLPRESSIYVLTQSISLKLKTAMHNVFYLKP